MTWFGSSSRPGPQPRACPPSHARAWGRRAERQGAPAIRFPAEGPGPEAPPTLVNDLYAISTFRAAQAMDVAAAAGRGPAAHSCLAAVPGGCGCCWHPVRRERSGPRLQLRGRRALDGGVEELDHVLQDGHSSARALQASEI